MLHLVTIEPDTLGLLKNLQSRPYLDKFFLVGGTALALQMGHRKSIDLDLFTLEDYDQEILLKQLQAEFEVDVKVSTPNKYKLSTMFHIIKSLTYFDDVEVDSQPFVFDKKVTWLKVKRFIQKSVQDLY